MTPQLDAFTKVAGLLEEAIFGNPGPAPGRAFFTVAHPGIFLSPTLTEKANSKDMMIAASILDPCFSATYIHTPLISTVSGIYADLITQAALPKTTLTTAQEARLQLLETRIATAYASYHKYKERYDAVQVELYAAIEAEAPASQIVALRQKLRAAENEWVVFGSKRQYEQDDSEVQYLRALSPELYFANLRTRFDESSQTDPAGVSFQPVYLEPPVSSWSSPFTGWNQFEKTFKYSTLTRRVSHSSWSGSVGLNFSLFKRFSVGADGSKIDEFQESTNIDITLKFEFMRVSIIRPWLRPDVFSARFWTYRQTFGYRQISDGYDPGSTGPTGPAGLMPVLPTHLIIARNVTITANFSADERKFVEETLKASGGGGWGPFSIRGSYQTTTTSEDVEGSFDGTTLRVPNPQIIGFAGTLLPRSPNPDRSLPWQGDQTFGDQPAPTPLGSGGRSARVEALLALHARQRELFGD